MFRELSAKHPAEIISVQPLPAAPARPQYPRRVTLTAHLHERERLMHQVHQMVKEGRWGHSYQMAWNEQINRWTVRVVELRPPATWIERHRWKLLGVGAGLILLALISYLIINLLAVGMKLLAAAGLAWLILTAIGAAGTATIKVIQVVNIRK